MTDRADAEKHILWLEARLAEAERERDEWKSKTEAMYHSETGYTIASLREENERLRRRWNRPRIEHVGHLLPGGTELLDGG
jgi:hypothetical protein